MPRFSHGSCVSRSLFSIDFVFYIDSLVNGSSSSDESPVEEQEGLHLEFPFRVVDQELNEKDNKCTGDLGRKPG